MARTVAAMWWGRKRKIERLHALGLRAPGGRPRKLRRALSLVDQAKERLRMASQEIRAHLPTEVEAMPSSELTAPQRLRKAALLGLDRLTEILEVPVSEHMDMKRQRLAGDMALGVCKLFMRAAEAEFRARKDDTVGRLLQELLAAEEQEADRARKQAACDPNDRGG